MSFSNMLEILQEKNKGKIVLIKLGKFYIATGRDAKLLSAKLNLKCTCFKENICKVGFPVDSLEKYVEKLNKIKYSYVIYEYDKKIQELKEIYIKEGRKNKIIEKNINCLICKGIDRYKNDEYMLAVERVLKNSEIINIVAYDEIADDVYRKIEKAVA